MLDELRLLLGDRYTDDAAGKQQQQKEKALRMSNQKGSATKIVQDFAVLRAAGSAWLRETKDKKNSSE